MVTVFANGIWKSGNHLLFKICSLLGIPGAHWGLGAHTLIGRYYFIRRLVRGPRWEKSPVPVGIDIPVVVGSRWLDRRFRRLNGTIIGGHAAFSDRLLRILQEKGILPIQIVRDPRDVLTSFAYWVETQSDYYAYRAFADLSIEERILTVIRGTQFGGLRLDSFGTVMDRCYGWLTRPNDVLVVRFEDIVGPKGGGTAAAQLAALERVAAWLGLRDADLDRVAAGSFGDTPTFRKGTIGSWRQHFTSEVRAVFDEVIGPRLELWGYKKE